MLPTFPSPVLSYQSVQTERHSVKNLIWNRNLNHLQMWFESHLKNTDFMWFFLLSRQKKTSGQNLDMQKIVLCWQSEHGLCMSSLFDMTDSDNQLVRRELHELN